MTAMSPLAQSVLRHGMQSASTAAATWLVGHQIVNGVDPTTLASTLFALGMALATAIWGAWANRKAGLVRAVAAMPEVSRVQVNNTDAGVKLGEAAGSTAAAPVTVRQS